jgi:C2 domain
LKIVDQKTTNEIGRFTYIIAHLMEKKDMEIINQPFQLQKSGPESKIVMALSLRVLKNASAQIEEIPDEKAIESGIKEEEPKPQLTKQDSRVSRTSINTNDAGSIEEPLIAPKDVSSNLSAAPRSSLSSSSSSLNRQPSVKSLKDETGPLGAINLTLQYSVQRQRFIVIIHRIKNIPLKDPSNIPDPYVKLYLLPGRSKDSKRRTNVIKDNCNPVFDATFEYLISTAELNSSQLEVTVSTDKLIGSPVLGMLKLDLNDPEIQGAGKNVWYNLLPEFKSTDL